MAEPIISTELLFQQVRSKVLEICDTIHDLDFPGLDLGLMTGKAGIVLFLAYHARIFQSEKSADLAVSLLESLIDDINKGTQILTFSDGLAGIAWLMLHLQRHNLIEFEADNDWIEIDDVLSKQMIHDLEHGNYDLLHGGSGYGIYFLERFFQNNEPYYLGKAIAALGDICENQGSSKIWWETDIHLDKTVHGVNLGMAHGMPGIISFLAKVHRSGAEYDNTMNMMMGASRYLLEQQNKLAGCRSCYPAWIGEGSPASSRLAWCYGDPGVGLAFLHAYDALKFEPWKDEYLRILNKNADRRSLEDNYIYDAGLCHGSAGIAQVFNRVYLKTGDELFRETSAFWIRVTLEMANHSDGLAGYKAYRGSKESSWATEAGLLEGIAGIGLALMTSLINDDLRWDECLMIQ